MAFKIKFRNMLHLIHFIEVTLNNFYLKKYDELLN